MTFRLPPLAAALAFILSSCGTGSYSRGFKTATDAMVRPPATAEGPWQGSWKSAVNGHHGPLWCIVRPAPDRPGHYDFRYRAGWGILRFGDYTHTMPARPASDGSMKLSGRMSLPGGLGTYRVEGRLTRDTFEAGYRSTGDHGTMSLRRPASRQ
ncbi:MAG: hypothetical protein K9N23_15065 [Akkermansiaceae bacterium]|nr:hypothetical protein [Akkermansiaceae bacterium]